MLSLYVSIGSCQPGHYIFIVLVFVLVVFDPSSADLYLSFPIDIVLVFVVVLFVVVLCMFSLWIRSFLSVPARYLHPYRVNTFISLVVLAFRSISNTHRQITL